MTANQILAALACAVLLVGTLPPRHRRPWPPVHSWLLVGAVFAAVSLWLFSRS